MNVKRDARQYAPVLLRGRWFAALPPAVGDGLLAAAQVQRLQPGERVFIRGDANTGLYGVVEGAICVGAVARDGREALLHLLEPPAWFGEIALLDDGVRTHDAYAHTASTLLWVPRQALETLLADNPLLWRHLGALAAEKLRYLFTRLEDMSVLPAQARVANQLAALARMGRRADDDAVYRVSVSQAQLGAMLGLTRQTVSEVLKALEAQGMVRCVYGGVEVLQWAGLHRVGQS